MTVEEQEKLIELETRYKNLLSRLQDGLDVMEACNQGVGSVVSADTSIDVSYVYGQESTGGKCTVEVESNVKGKLITEITSSTPEGGKNTKYTITYGKDNKKCDLVLETGQAGKMDTTLTTYYANGAVQNKFSCTAFSGSFTGCSTSLTGVSFGATVYSFALTGVSMGADICYATYATFDAEVVASDLEASTVEGISQANEATISAVAEDVKTFVQNNRIVENRQNLLEQQDDGLDMRVPGPAIGNENDVLRKE